MTDSHLDDVLERIFTGMLVLIALPLLVLFAPVVLPCYFIGTWIERLDRKEVSRV
jgi:hypothetical protein